MEAPNFPQTIWGGAKTGGEECHHDVRCQKTAEPKRKPESIRRLVAPYAVAAVLA